MPAPGSEDSASVCRHSNPSSPQGGCESQWAFAAQDSVFPVGDPVTDRTTEKTQGPEFELDFESPIQG